jgi:hypothetical protein
MSELLNLQMQFLPLVARLIDWVYANGYTLTTGEAWRSPAEAAINAQAGAGIACSLHTERLAIDLNLFKDGEYMSDLESYRPVGDYWKSLNPLARWGGDFASPDMDHFSLTWGGVS